MILVRGLRTVAFGTRLFLALALLLAPAACRPREAREVILYSSVDESAVRPVLAEFEAASGIKVRLVEDTEATKTTGLIQRLLAEKERPRADAWWSSEALGTIRLAREGILEPFTPSAGQFEGGWPAPYRASDHSWHAFAVRARVVAYAEGRVADPPDSLEALANARWKGRAGIARPQFGTTRSHMAGILLATGEDAFRDWAQRLRANDLRLYDGNASIVRAIAHGEIDLGLTDSDDVHAARRNGWKVAMVTRYAQAPGAPPSEFGIPNTVALIRGGPHPDAARRLLDYILSPEVERMLWEGESRNWPIHPGLADEPPPQSPLLPELTLDAADRAVAIFAEVFAE